MGHRGKLWGTQEGTVGQLWCESVSPPTSVGLTGVCHGNKCWKVSCGAGTNLWGGTCGAAP